MIVAVGADATWREGAKVGGSTLGHTIGATPYPSPLGKGGTKELARPPFEPPLQRPSVEVRIDDIYARMKPGAASFDVKDAVLPQQQNPPPQPMVNKLFSWGLNDFSELVDVVHQPGWGNYNPELLSYILQDINFNVVGAIDNSSEYGELTLQDHVTPCRNGQGNNTLCKHMQCGHDPIIPTRRSARSHPYIVLLSLGLWHEFADRIVGGERRRRMLRFNLIETITLWAARGHVPLSRLRDNAECPSW